MIMHVPCLLLTRSKIHVQIIFYHIRYLRRIWLYSLKSGKRCLSVSVTFVHNQSKEKPKNKISREIRTIRACHIEMAGAMISKVISYQGIMHLVVISGMSLISPTPLKLVPSAGPSIAEDIPIEAWVRPTPFFMTRLWKRSLGTTWYIMCQQNHTAFWSTICFLK